MSTDKQLHRTLNALANARQSLTVSDVDQAVRELYVAVDEMLRYLLEHDGANWPPPEDAEAEASAVERWAETYPQDAAVVKAIGEALRAGRPPF